MAESLTIYAQRVAPCLSCGQPIQPGEQCHWEPEIGSWHIDCSAPLKLEVWRRGRACARRRA